MKIKTSVLHLKGAKGAKVRKEKQFVGRNKRSALRRMRCCLLCDLCAFAPLR